MTRLDDHEAAVRERHDLVEAADGVGELPASYCRRAFAGTTDPDAVAAADETATIVCTGVGMTGPPHLGTLGQLHLARDLQRAGLDVQFVLADLEPYHGGVDLATVRRRAARYRSLLLALGFDPDRGTVRTQEAGVDALQTAALLAPHCPVDQPSTDHGQTAWERSVAAAYDDAPTPDGPTSEQAATVSRLLHLADLLHPLRAQGYDQVVTLFGADECGLTRWARAATETVPIDGRVVGLHTRLVPGVDGAPKMSKSVPGTAIHLGQSPDTVRAAVRDFAADRPAGAARAICLARPPSFDLDEPTALDGLWTRDPSAWASATTEYADYVADLAARWGRDLGGGVRG